MSNKITIDFEKLEIDGNFYNREKYPIEGGRFLVSDGVTRNIVVVPKGISSGVFTIPLPEDMQINEATERLKIDFVDLIKSEFEKLHSKLSTIKQTSQSGISEETLLRLAEIMNK